MSDTDLDEDFMPRSTRSRWPTMLIAALVVIGIVIIGAWLSFSEPAAPDNKASNLPAFKLPQRMSAPSAETRLKMDGGTADTDIEARVQGLAQAAAEPRTEVATPSTPSDEAKPTVAAVTRPPITAAATQQQTPKAVAQAPVPETKAETVATAKVENEPRDSAEPDQPQTPAQPTVQDKPAPALDDLEVILAAAAADVRRDRLTSPAGSNAFERYQQVLARDPGNEQANSGLRDIVARYIALAQRVSKDGRLAKAESFLKRAQSIGVGGDELTSAREQLAKLQANQ